VEDLGHGMREHCKERRACLWRIRINVLEIPVSNSKKKKIVFLELVVDTCCMATGVWVLRGNVSI
jgi:hypothetical protein